MGSPLFFRLSTNICDRADADIWYKRFVLPEWLTADKELELEIM